MDVVLRTSHGEAELSLGPLGDEITLGDVIEHATGRTAPPVAYVDGRAVPTSTAIGTAGLLAGSIVSTTDDAAPTRDGAVVELVQIAGRGAGSRAWLVPGEYRIGPGHRVSAPELDLAPVESAALELSVHADRSVSLRATGRPARLDGRRLATDRVEAWTTGILDVDGRAFRLERRDPSAPTGLRRFAGVGVDGTAAFNRPPRPAVDAGGEPLTVPEGGREVRAARRFPLVAMLAPIPIAVAMAVLLGNPRFMLFGLMSPVLAGANWLSDRRTHKRDSGEAARADAGATAAFTAEAAARHAAERDRRRAADPDLASAAHLAEAASPELWQRRPGDPDVFHVSLGLADLEWSPELERSPGSLGEADAIVEGLGPLPMVPVVADLGGERGLGLVGRSGVVRSIARGVLVTTAVTHGPADLDVVVLTSPQRIDRWEWAKWLPHVRAGGSPRVLADAEQVATWTAAVRAGWERPARPTAPNHLTLVVVDEPSWWRDRNSPLRPLFGDPSLPLRFLALTDTAEDVPAVCTTVATELPSGALRVEHLLDRRRIDDVLPWMCSIRLALDVARRLAPLDDPDLPMVAETALPSVVPILRLLGIESPDAATFIDRWGAAGRAASPVVQAGVSERGTLTIDLVADGPHGLVAGTTGSGKSELLRSLVVGLAANLPPNDLNVVLVDFKGGSAFDACADLPHTVGLVTDLDEHLAGRVLRCLRAELQHREHVLRDAGASSLEEYRLLAAVDPLPRLVLVVDEFASVAAELPEFMPSLVDIAQRGRSLGLHMILATQRPAGVVDNKIKANTNLRVALRVQDDGDSLDVIGTREAAALPRRVPGRAYARFGAGELTLFQSAYSTGVSGDDRTAGLEIRPFVVGRDLTPLEHRVLRAAGAAEQHDPDRPTDLEQLVGAIREAAVDLGQHEQRRPYPDPLPDRLPLDELLARHPGDGVPFALVDLPDEQRQEPVWWQPGADGSLIAYGIAGSGTSSLLVSLALGVATRQSADDVHLYCIDADTNVLAPLAALPHTGAVIRLDEAERIARLARHLGEEVDRRKALAIDAGGPQRVAATEPAIVLLLDNVGALRQVLDDRRDLDGTWQEIERVVRDGQSLGLCAVLTAKQERAVPPALATQIPNRLVLRLGDQFGYAGFGFRPADVPAFVPGRALRPDDTAELQLAMPPPNLATMIESLGLEPPTDRAVRRIDPLPATISIGDVAGGARLTARALEIPVGLDTRTAEPALAVAPFGETVLVSGAAGSGRSSVLAAFATGAHHADPTLPVFAVGPRGGPLADLDALVDRPATPQEVAAWVDRVATTPGRRLVLVDDADRLGGPSFERLAALRDDDVVVVLAGRADDLKAMNHWSKPLQRFRNGVLLRPAVADGDLLRVSLGVRLPRFAAHRGLLVNDGDVVPILAAIASEPARSGEPAG